MQLASILRTHVGHLYNRRLPRPAFESRRQRRWRAFCRFVHESSPYYLEVMDRHGLDPETCLPQDFPVLTKQTVMERFDDLVTDPGLTLAKVQAFLDTSRDPRQLLEGRWVIMNTSGTSGRSGVFAWTLEDMRRSLTHGALLGPISLRRRRVAFVGTIAGHWGGVGMMCALERLLPGFCDLQLIDVSWPLQRIMDRLSARPPAMLIGYASTLVLLAEAQRRGRLRLRPEMCVSSAEALLPEQRTFIEEAFGAPCVNHYASTEHLAMGLCFPGQDSMRLLEDDLVFEIHDDHTCVTNLLNRTLPLIRYRMADVLRPVAGDGRTPYAQVGQVVGRAEHTQVFTNRRGADEALSYMTVSQLYDPRVRAYQLQVLGRTSFRFCVVPDGGVGREEWGPVRDDVAGRLRQMLAEKELDNLRFEVEVVPDLPLDPRTGKLPLILPRCCPTQSKETR